MFNATFTEPTEKTRTVVLLKIYIPVFESPSDSKFREFRKLRISFSEKSFNNLADINTTLIPLVFCPLLLTNSLSASLVWVFLL